jgi:SnoaL-like domain
VGEAGVVWRRPPLSRRVDRIDLFASAKERTLDSRTASGGTNVMGDNAELAAKFTEVLESNDFGRLSALIQEYATDDFVDEWPQSGERMTKESSVRLSEAYPEMSGTTPQFTYKRMIGGGDIFVVEGTIDYGDGVPVSYVGIGELRDGKVAKMTDYFANPFPAPAWRAEFVERMEPTPA